MARRSTKVNFPSFVSPSALQHEIDAYMQAFVRAAATKWLSVVTPIIPVYSGSAKISFGKLASQVGFTLVVVPRVRRPAKYARGIATSTGGVFKNGTEYGFEWSSDMPHIGIVDDRVRFTAVGNAALKFLPLPKLPSPLKKTPNGK